MAARRPPQPAPRGGGDWQRYAAPVVFLVAVTVAVLLVRGSLGDRTATAPATTAAATTATATTAAKKKPNQKASTAKTTSTQTSASAEYYEVQSGDTFGVIASKYGKTVEEIEALNPGVSSTSLHIGQKIRVG